MDRILLSRPIYLQIVRHVTQAAPMEAVGIIGGLANGRAHSVIELPNLAGPHEFFADPFAQYQAERRFSREGLSVIAIYHSHPGGGTTLSDADRMGGARWNCSHIVIVLPGALALIFSIQDFGSFLWTLFNWRAERR
jgi:proteasome lid subunit RPN8/RPN11